MKRHWFQSRDGAYYRNAPLVLDEMRRAIWRPRLYLRLERELHEIWRQGAIRKTALDKGDVVVERAPFRVSYPDMPELSRWFDREDQS